MEDLQPCDSNKSWWMIALVRPEVGVHYLAWRLVLDVLKQLYPTSALGSVLVLGYADMECSSPVLIDSSTSNVEVELTSNSNGRSNLLRWLLYRFNVGSRIEETTHIIHPALHGDRIHGTDEEISMMR
jgi:hypothetical protein